VQWMSRCRPQGAGRFLGGQGAVGAGRAAALRAFDDLKLDFAKVGAR
jgi:hypothetical protein